MATTKTKPEASKKPKPNTVKKTKPEAAKAPKYTREALLKSQRFAGYQRDFLAVILREREYTMAEAEQAVNNFFGKD